MSPTAIAKADLTWLNMDVPTNLMVVNGVMWFSEEPDWDAVRETLRTRLIGNYPVMSCRPQRVDGDWVWEDDPDFDLERHIRVVTLPEPGDRATAQDYISMRISQPLDREHPLWEFDFISGYTSPDGAAGAMILARFHHVLADGIRIVQLILGMCDVEGDAAPPAVGRSRTASNPVSTAARAASAIHSMNCPPSPRPRSVPAGRSTPSACSKTPSAVSPRGIADLPACSRRRST